MGLFAGGRRAEDEVPQGRGDAEDPMGFLEVVAEMVLLQVLPDRGPWLKTVGRKMDPFIGKISEKNSGLQECSRGKTPCDQGENKIHKAPEDGAHKGRRQNKIFFIGAPVMIHVKPRGEGFPRFFSLGPMKDVSMKKILDQGPGQGSCQDPQDGGRRRSRMKMEGKGRDEET